MSIVPLVAEFLGTFVFLSVILYTGNWLAIAAALALVILAIGSVSGGHVNPAVSLAMYVKGALSAQELGLYIVAQALGAVAAVYAIKNLA